MNDLLIVSPSPHIRSKRTTSGIMGDVLIALMPACFASVILFGLRAFLMLLVSNIACGIFEFLFSKIRKTKNTIFDLSAFVTGTLLALSLPASLGEWKNLWMLVIGAFVAIIIVKALFGGIGCNFANPAIVGRIVLFICFSAAAANVPTVIQEGVDAVSGATPLALIKEGSAKELPSLLDMFLGNRGGAIGEGCTLALLIGGIYLLVRRVITWHIPLCFMATVWFMTFVLGQQPLYQLMAGGLILAAFFMATDYTTSPDTPLGKIIYGIGCGLITVLIRLWGAYPEGVSFAILIMNILNPYIIKLTRRKAFGGIKK